MQWPQCALLLELVRRVLRVVDEQVDAVAEVEHLVGDEVVGLAVDAPLTVVGQVGDRDAVQLEAVAERRSDVPDPPRAHLRVADREVVVAGVVEVERALELSGRIGKYGGRIIPANTSPSGPSACWGP